MSVMLTLIFEPLSGATHTVGPTPSFRLAGTSLRLGPQDVEVATYRNGQWHVAGRSFTVILVEKRATVHFEPPAQGSSTAFGPFERVRLVDGAIRYGEKSGVLLARLDEGSRRWEVCL